MKNVNIIRVHEKSSLYGGHKGGNCEYIGDLRGAWQKRGGWGFCQWGSYPNAHYELGNNFNYDFNVPMPMFSPLISNKKKSTILQLIGLN